MYMPTCLPAAHVSNAGSPFLRFGVTVAKGHHGMDLASGRRSDACASITLCRNLSQTTAILLEASLQIHGCMVCIVRQRHR
mmetsp:Transcript_12173/g.28968  ORF Transcript_12173/g.28968 Transcript_12173/m.28968 type:complete len:81 (-) Transcript_12173:86-328(-)